MQILKKNITKIEEIFLLPFVTVFIIFTLRYYLFKHCTETKQTYQFCEQ